MMLPPPGQLLSIRRVYRTMRNRAKVVRFLLAALPVLLLSFAQVAHAQTTTGGTTFDPSTVPAPDFLGMCSSFVARFWAGALVLVPLALVGIMGPKAALSWFINIAGKMARRS